MKYKHTKTGGIYRQLAVALDTTNSREGKLVVVYCLDVAADYAIYVRDQDEFNQKFEPVESPL